jgi:hypothetical protein
MVFRPSFCSRKSCSSLFPFFTVYNPFTQINQELNPNGRKPIRARYMKKERVNIAKAEGGQKITKPELIEWNIMKAMGGQRMTKSELIKSGLWLLRSTDALRARQTLESHLKERRFCH